MDRPRQHGEHDPTRGLDETTPLDAVCAELGEIEALDRQVSDLMAALRACLPPEHFRLVWSLRDAVECRAIAEGLLRDRRLADRLARALPADSAALQAIRRHLLADELVIDETD